MYLSNIKKIEIEALALTIFLHFLALLLYGVINIRPIVQPEIESVVKLNLAGMSEGMGGLEPVLEADHPPSMPEPKLHANAPAANAGSFIAGPVDEIFAAKPPVDIQFANVGGAIPKPAPASQSPIISELLNDKAISSAKDYVELLQTTVQQKSNIPAEAAMNGISGKAVLRLEIDRKGHVKSYSLKQSTGNKILDTAAAELGARLMTEPFPAPPASFYPTQKTLKFDFSIDYDPANQ